MKITKYIIACSIACSFQVASSAERTQWEYNQQETASYFSGVREIAYAGWGPMNARVSRIVGQLIQHSKQVYRVVPGQTFQWGQAHAGGWIILDISSASKSDAILAFRLAHEWGHQALGHQPNFYHPEGSSWRYRASKTSEEDEADEYAGKFLAKYNYPLEEVDAELQSLPHTASGDTHSDGRRRATIVVTAYTSAMAGDLVEDKYCSLDGDGYIGKCKVANLSSSSPVSCRIQMTGITKLGGVLVNTQTRVIPYDHFVIQTVVNRGDLDADPLVKVYGNAVCN